MVLLLGVSAVVEVEIRPAALATLSGECPRGVERVKLSQDHQGDTEQRSNHEGHEGHEEDKDKNGFESIRVLRVLRGASLAFS
jgi:hypothetical protein